MSSAHVLILSKWNAGGVRAVARLLRGRGLIPVLVSALADDLNANACAEHVVIDWDTDELSALTSRLAAADIQPIAVINQVEALISWQIQIASHYGLAGGEPLRSVLLSKATLRSAMREAGLSTLRSVSGTSADINVGAIDFYPAMAKPSRQSGASSLVRRVDGPTALLAHLAEIERQLGEATEILIEEYVTGVEFSVDGPILDGRYQGAVVFEKTDYDYDRNHEAGVLICPPTLDYVAAGAAQLSSIVNDICAVLGLRQGWLHAEGRVQPDGDVQLIEINPRPGGGLYCEAVQHLTGVDPDEMVLTMALAHSAADEPFAAGLTVAHNGVLGLLVFEPDQLGTVECDLSTADLKALPGVVDGFILNGYRVETLDQENFFSWVLIEAEDVPALRMVADKVRSAMTFRMSLPV